MAKHKLDFQIIKSDNKNHILFLDKSEYMENPAVPVLLVRFPGWNEDHQAPIKPNTYNILNSTFLDYSDCEIALPDGLYHYTYAIAPHDVLYKCKWDLRTNELDCKMQELLADVDIHSKKEIDEFYAIDKLVTAAKSLADTNQKQSIELFKFAVTKLEKLNCK